MDLNYLYHRQQVSLMRADLAVCVASRAAHEGLAHLYGARIDQQKAERWPIGLRPRLGLRHPRVI